MIARDFMPQMMQAVEEFTTVPAKHPAGISL
jgi:hypothetical protein